MGEAFDLSLREVTDWLEAHGFGDLDFDAVREVRFSPQGIEVTRYVRNVSGNFYQQGDDMASEVLTRGYANT